MRTILLLALLLSHSLRAEEVAFQDDFKDGIDKGWTWVREDPKAWRSTSEGLEIRVLPGNMWGPPNNAKNVLVRELPELAKDRITVSVKVLNKPTEQYEQVNLVWYFDDSNMVKLGLEQVDKKLCVVMGREENDRTRTIAVIPKATPSLQVRLTVQGKKIEGHYRLDGSDRWLKAGECELPSISSKPKISLQAYQGPDEVEHWAKITDFKILRIPESK